MKSILRLLPLLVMVLSTWVQGVSASEASRSHYCQLILANGHLPMSSLWDEQRPLLRDFPAGLLGVNDYFFQAAQILRSEPTLPHVSETPTRLNVFPFVLQYPSRPASELPEPATDRSQQIEFLSSLRKRAIDKDASFLTFHRKWVNIAKFLPGFRGPHDDDTYEPVPFGANPLALLPREMQNKILNELLNSASQSPDSLSRAVMAEIQLQLQLVPQTRFALDGSTAAPQLSGRSIPLDRLPIHEEVLFQKFLAHYFGSRRPLTQEEFIAALNEHIILIPNVLPTDSSH